MNVGYAVVVDPLPKPLLHRLVSKQSKTQRLGRLTYKIFPAQFGRKLEDLGLLLRENSFFFS